MWDTQLPAGSDHTEELLVSCVLLTPQLPRLGDVLGSAVAVLLPGTLRNPAVLLLHGRASFLPWVPPPHAQHIHPLTASPSLPQVYRDAMNLSSLLRWRADLTWMMGIKGVQGCLCHVPPNAQEVRAKGMEWRKEVVLKGVRG